MSSSYMLFILLGESENQICYTKQNLSMLWCTYCVQGVMFIEWVPWCGQG
jgi:hypothetical protein